MSPRIPRDLGGLQLAQALRAFNPLRTGTLGAILTDVARHFGVSRDALLEQLFG